MGIINGIITIIALSFVIGGFIRQDVTTIGLSLIPLIFYGLTFLSMLLWDTGNYDNQFAGVMGVVNILLSLCSAGMIVAGLFNNQIMLLNWGFPLLIISFLTAIAILNEE